MNTLTDNDLRYVASRLPKDIRDLLTAHPGKLFLAGGFVRATIAGETPADIDLFGNDADWLRKVASGLALTRQGARTHRSENAVSVLTSGRMMIQFITRWTFDTPDALVASFDFTVCQAAIWRTPGGGWQSRCSESFYPDLAARRLVYTSPVRIEEAGGSMLRVIKYIQRGYNIQVPSLGAVVARLVGAVDYSDTVREDEAFRARILTGLLRQVDPNSTIDGFEIVEEHTPVEGFE